jgi:nitrite reductase/ring-hydroxylating ferredoxin subunit
MTKSWALRSETYPGPIMTYQVALPSAAVPDGEIVPVSVVGRDILICRTGNSVFAADDRCPHAGARLSGGKLKADQIVCPLHGARFDLASGECRSKVQGFAAMKVHETRERGGMIEVDLP